MLQARGVDATGQYIDVHVHVRGTTHSGILGNAGPNTDRPKRHGQRGSLGGISTERKNTDASEEDNLNRAARMMIAKMDSHGVQQALVVVVPGPHSNENEYASMRKVVQAYPRRLKLMAGGAMLSPYLQNMPPDKVTDDDRSKFRAIAEQVLNDGAVGFGEMLSYHLSLADHHSFQYAPADHPLFLELADIAAKHDVPIDMHMEAIVAKRAMPDNLQRASAKNPKTLNPTIPAFERLLEHNRKARIVWQHIGWDNTGDMTAGLVERLLTDHKNLYIALRVESRIKQVGSGPAMPNRLIDKKGALRPEWRAIIEKFSDRITIGSDEFFFPVESKRPNQSFDETWSLLDQLPKPLSEKLGRDNPRRIYNLK